MKDISVSFATTAYIQVLNIATGLIAARILLPEGRGELAALMLWPGLIAELGNLGLSDALLYRLSAARTPPHVVFGTAILLTIALCAVLIPLGLAILPFAMSTLDADIMAAAHWYMMLFLPIYFASLFVTIRALRHVGCVLPIQVWYLGRNDEMPAAGRLAEHHAGNHGLGDAFRPCKLCADGLCRRGIGA